MSWSIVAAHRQIMSRETGTVVKDWGGKIPVALAYANTYRTGMSNLGFQALYGLFNDYGDVVCERFFLPDRALESEYERTGTPLLSLESQRPLGEFELAAFSLSHENDYPGLVRMLQLSRINPWREQREESLPPIAAGGVTMSTNPEPLADFLDLILIGDGEIIVPELLRALRQVRSTPLPKNDRVRHLARKTPGAYAPGLYEAALGPGGRLASFTPKTSEVPEKVYPARSRKLPAPALVSRVLTPDTEFSNTKLVELGRGCPRGCRFCLVGFVYRPPRYSTAEAIQAAVGPALKKGERVGLVSSAVADHPELTAIIKSLTEQGRQVTVSSLRVDGLTPELVEALALGRMKSAAVAPEAGTERLRAVINKGLTEEEIIHGVGLLAEAGVSRLKLYFMIGLPTETREDVRGAADLTLRIKDSVAGALKGRKLQPEITVSLSSYVPKPFTPFENEPMLEMKELKARAKLMRDALKGRAGVRFHFDQPKSAYLQALLSRGDRRTSRVVAALAENGGQLAGALAEAPFDPDDFVTRPWEAKALKPWSFIDHGLKPGYLRSERDRAFKGRLSPDCRVGECFTCGVCPAEERTS